MFVGVDSFIGDTEVGQLSDIDIKNDLLQSCAIYEEDYLQKIFGSITWSAFKASVNTGTPDDKWLSILNGSDYFDLRGLPNRFEGLVSSLEQVVSSYFVPDDIPIVIGGDGEYDPDPGESVYKNPTLPADYTKWRVLRVGYGQLGANQITKADNGFTLKEGSFGLGEEFTIQFTSPIQINVFGISPYIRPSPVTYYIYYWHQRKNSTIPTGGGEVEINKANSRNRTSALKQATAWNKMVDLNIKLRDMMLSNLYLYPDFNSYHKRKCNKEYWNLFQKINARNI